MKLSVGILISGSGSNMVQLVKSMDDEHPAFASVVISNKSETYENGLLNGDIIISIKDSEAIWSTL